jgi:hypothetical protein
VRFLHVLTIVAAVGAGLFLMGAFAQNGAPQQAAVAAIAVGIAVIPYIMMRGFDSSRTEEIEQIKKLNETLEKQGRIIASLAEARHEEKAI